MEVREINGQFVLGLDIGTTTLKGLLWEPREGTIARVVSREHRSLVNGDAHEQDPAGWEIALHSLLSDLFELVDPASITAIGLSGQMHTLLLVDEQGTPVRPAITWADRRASSQAEVLAREPLFQARGLNQVVEAFTAPRLAWLVDNEPSTVQRAATWLGAKDYLRYLLTGDVATDPSDAMGTLLWDPSTRKWDDDLFALCGATSTLGPPIDDSVAERGGVSRQAAEKTGLIEGTPVFCGAGDVSAAVVGAGVTDSQTVCLNAGTAAQAMRLTQVQRHPNGFLFHPAVGEGMLAMSSSYAAGASAAWAQNTFGFSPTIWDIAEGGTSSSAGLTYLPYMMGSAAPSKNDAVRAGFLGQNPSHSAENFAAAVLEGVAFSCADSVDQVSALGAQPENLILVGGVSRSRRWRDLLANTLDISVYHLPEGGSALGAAVLAAVGSEALDVGDVSGRVLQSANRVTPTSEEGRDRQARRRFQHFSSLLINGS
ncbi:D-xylulokinase-like protein [Pontimonas salivibrio]|uniref:D-xylulokinase-like protein n=1 Tax=Pontimonas salivibrio TaxID=1159327 RepID=A0A2L2BP93_9MICO|nr:D-xylulokinase-like protein [Pontimonas salivibrio]